MDFEVQRDDFRRTRVVDRPGEPLAPGQIRLAVERIYHDMVEGRAAASVGHILSMTPDAFGA